MKRSLSRDYYYDLDLHGLLFLSDTTPKNITSCFKDSKFLDFFFSRLKSIHSLDKRISNLHDLSSKGYLFCSPCGIEMNYIRVADSPVVFTRFDASRNTIGWAGSLEIPFNPSQIWISKQSGRFYHSLPSGMPKPAWTANPVGLMSSSLIQSYLVNNIREDGKTIEYQGIAHTLSMF